MLLKVFSKDIIAHPSYGRLVKKLTDIDDRIYDCMPESFNYSVDAFFMCYSPHAIYERFVTDCVSILPSSLNKESEMLLDNAKKRIGDFIEGVI